MKQTLETQVFDAIEVDAIEVDAIEVDAIEVDAIEVLDDLFGNAPGYREAVAEEVERLNIARVIHEARVAAGLSQKQLADKIGSRQSVISRLEDADYGAQSLTMLRRIAQALGKRLEVKFAPGEPESLPESLPAPARRESGGRTVREQVKQETERETERARAAA